MCRNDNSGAVDLKEFDKEIFDSGVDEKIHQFYQKASGNQSFQGRSWFVYHIKVKEIYSVAEVEVDHLGVKFVCESAHWLVDRAKCESFCASKRYSCDANTS